MAIIFFTQGIKHIPALEANLIGTLEPVLNPIWVFLFYGESMGSCINRRIGRRCHDFQRLLGSARAAKESE
ncbi:MAG: hypothetical protein IPL17_17885 [Anaerolineales bacterium]|nr:hypothetical protein [Anaerolineales bacterium]